MRYSVRVTTDWVLLQKDMDEYIEENLLLLSFLFIKLRRHRKRNKEIDVKDLVNSALERFTKIKGRTW